MKWLITGGCGFIGSSLVKRLTEEGGHHIRILDNLAVGNRQDLQSAADYREVNTTDLTDEPGVFLLVGDIMDAELAMQVAANCDVIVHLAANTGVAPSVEDPRSDCTTNVIGTLNMLEAARHNGVKRFVFASSGAPIGEAEPPLHEEMAPHPVSPYGASKLAGEGYCSAYYRTFGVETVALRFGNVYGPRSTHKSSVVAKFIKQALAGEPLEIYGDGKQTRDFIYIDDLIEAVRLAAEVNSAAGQTFQIATNSETTVSELMKCLRVELIRNGVKDVDVEFGQVRVGDVTRNYSDNSKARSQLGWLPTFNLESGLAATVSSFLNGN